MLYLPVNRLLLIGIQLWPSPFRNLFLLFHQATTIKQKYTLEHEYPFKTSICYRWMIDLSFELEIELWWYNLTIKTLWISYHFRLLPELMIFQQNDAICKPSKLGQPLYTLTTMWPLSTNRVLCWLNFGGQRKCSHLFTQQRALSNLIRCWNMTSVFHHKSRNYFKVILKEKKLIHQFALHWHFLDINIDICASS